MSILESIFILLSSAMSNMKLFGAVFPLVVEKFDGTNSFPAYYKDSGEYDKLLIEDKFRGVTYFRKDGAIRSSKNTSEKYKTNSCNGKIFYDITIPVKQVIFLPREKISCDNAFAEDDFALQVVSRLTDPLINNYIQNVSQLSFTSTGYETESTAVLKQEYSNWKEIVDLDYNHIYISIDWELFFVADSVCLDSCERPVGLPGIPVLTAESNFVLSHIPHTNVKYGTLAQVSPDVFAVPEGNYKSGSLVLFYNGQQTAFFTELTNGQFQTGWTPVIGVNNQLTAMYIPLS